jgi:spore germination protein YaaH
MESRFIVNRKLIEPGRAALGAALTMLLATAFATGVEEYPTKHDSTKAVPAADVTLARARRQVLDAHPLAMFYYANDVRGRESLAAHASAMTLLAPQSYWLDREGFVHGQIRAEVLDVARRTGLALMPLVVNPHFDRLAAHALLHNPKAQEQAAMSLAYLAKRDHFVGWQLDIENIDPDDKLDYTNFVELVAARVHRDRCLLSVAVVPRFSDTYPDSPPAQFQTIEWGAAYDYAALGRVADFLTLMTYDQHSSLTPPGPVAGYDWVKAALDYAVRCVPPAKLLLGLPLYGREWVETPHGTTTHSVTYRILRRFLKNTGSVPQWDENSRTTWFQARSGAAQRTVWFDDARSLREKLQLIESYHLRGFACWRLGVEDPKFWMLTARKKVASEN